MRDLRRRYEVQSIVRVRVRRLGVGQEKWELGIRGNVAYISCFPHCGLASPDYYQQPSDWR